MVTFTISIALTNIHVGFEDKQRIQIVKTNKEQQTLNIGVTQSQSRAFWKVYERDSVQNLKQDCLQFISRDCDSW